MSQVLHGSNSHVSAFATVLKAVVFTVSLGVLSFFFNKVPYLD